MSVTLAFPKNWRDYIQWTRKPNCWTAEMWLAYWQDGREAGEFQLYAGTIVEKAEPTIENLGANFAKVWSEDHAPGRLRLSDGLWVDVDGLCWMKPSELTGAHPRRAA